VKGLIAIPLKIAGSAISTIVMSIEAMNVPSVVFERTTHLYSTIELLPGSCLLLSGLFDHDIRVLVGSVRVDYFAENCGPNVAAWNVGRFELRPAYDLGLLGGFGSRSRLGLL